MRVWEVATGKCKSVVQVGGHVDSLLMESGYLFVGMHITNAPDRPGLIKVATLMAQGAHLVVLFHECSRQQSYSRIYLLPHSPLKQ